MNRPTTESPNLKIDSAALKKSLTRIVNSPGALWAKAGNMNGYRIKSVQFYFSVFIHQLDFEASIILAFSSPPLKWCTNFLTISKNFHDQQLLRYRMAES